MFNKNHIVCKGLGVLAVFLLTVIHGGYASESLEKYFLNPPPDCRPEVLWDWMGGMVSREGITKDLEALKAQGVGGVMIMQMPDQCPYPRQWSFRDYTGKVKCLSDEYFEMMNYATGEADRLGLNMAVFVCPGWSHCGGPWVTPEKSLKKLAVARKTVSGPAKLDEVLPKPPISKGHGGGNEIPSWSEDTEKPPKPRENFYRDEAVLGVPRGGTEGAIPVQGIVDLTGFMSDEGRLTWEVPEGTWEVWRLAIVSENGMNHPSPIEGIGLECDRMDPEAVRLVFDGFAGRICREAKAKGYKSFRGFETDSYEAGFQDYGADFRKEFLRRRGYDCLSWLPAWLDSRVVIDGAQQSRRFRMDMTRTITALWSERFHATLQQLAEENELQWLIEPYWGVPIDWRTVSGKTSMPGSEFWVGSDHLGGASPETAALYGQKVVWAEAFTAESYNSAWRNDPWVLKRYGDRAFCRGVNHFFMHGFVHNPFPDEHQPGLTMGYWGTQLSRYVTWWPFSRPWHEYLTRCQYMLRQGVSAYDVLLYPADIQIVVRTTDGKYRQALLTDEVLEKLTVRNGKLVLPHGNEFAAIALNPELPLRPEMLEKIRKLVHDGAVLVGDPPPAYSASLENYPDCDHRMAELIESLWGERAAESSYGQGRVFSGLSLDEALEKAIGLPDLVCRMAGSSELSPVRSAHRRIGDTEVWFISHQGEQTINVEASFRISGMQPEWWDPLDGSHRALPDFRFEGGCTVVPLKLYGLQSGFVVFRGKTENPPAIKDKRKTNFPSYRQAMEIAGPWEVSFDPKWGGPEKIVFEKLEDWSKSLEAGIRYYSGRALYQKTFDVDHAELLKPETGILISLSQVHNLARIRINGNDLGIIWCAPWALEIPKGVLKRHNNKLEIEVVNTWVNRLIGDEQEPEDCELEPGNLTGMHAGRKGSYRKDIPSRGLKDLPDWFVEGRRRPSEGRLTFTSWRFYDRQAPLQPSGLLGPVTISLVESSFALGFAERK